MPAVNGVGKPCAGEPHARFDGRELETEHDRATATEKNDPAGNRGHRTAPRPTVRTTPPRQLPTPNLDLSCGR